MALYISDEQYPISGQKIWESPKAQGEACVTLPNGKYQLMFEGNSFYV